MAENSDGIRCLASDPLTSIPGIGTAKTKLFRNLEITTVEELITHFPRRYEDRTQFPNFPSTESESPLCLTGWIVHTQVKRLPGRRHIFDVTVQETADDASGVQVTLRWFNVYYVQKMVNVGDRIVFFGKPRLRAKKIVFDHPEFEVIAEDDDDIRIHFRRIAPIYPATAGISQRVIRTAVYQALKHVDRETLEEIIPEKLCGDLTRYEALRRTHFPKSESERLRARENLVLTEFFDLQMRVGLRRYHLQGNSGVSHATEGKIFDAFIRALPFVPTKAQLRAIAEIREDLKSAKSMHRLLQGDVGSGKTLVALAAMLVVIEAGYSAVLMAPTQILAEQHFSNFRGWLSHLPIRIELRTSQRREGDPEEDSLFRQNSSKLQGKNGAEPRVIVGTHALLYDRADLPEFGLVVVDEQHKFGVAQRAKLGANQSFAPDLLVMTATPIPRTLVNTIYGDLDVTVLDEMPEGRGKVTTHVRSAEKLPDATKFVKTQIENGRQAYLVYPLIEESTNSSAKAVKDRFAYWQTALTPFSVGLLHGRLRADEKERVMNDFRHGRVHALVSTTVIEVGVDVKNANLILIENAERFGLAQLHQLRGRIGRGQYKSFCILLTGSETTDEAVQRLQIMEASTDGFAIAEADLRWRGPGDMIGTAQSGLSPLRLGDLFADAKLMKLAREAAREILTTDPYLQEDQHTKYRVLIPSLESESAAIAD